MKSLEERIAERKKRRKAAGHDYNPGVTTTENLSGNGAGEDGPDGGLSDMTVAKLKEHAAANNIDLGDATKKDDIIAAIELAQEGK